jgi:hypothetical protein
LIRRKKGGGEKGVQGKGMMKINLMNKKKKAVMIMTRAMLMVLVVVNSKLELL